MNTILKNYRPLSNLNFVGKLIEKAVSAQLNNHSKANSLGETLQSAYKPGHSCETAMLKITNDILINLDQNHGILLSLLDLSAAFDTVDHALLLERLTSTKRISGQVIKWIESYLTDRTMHVNVNGKSSEPVLLEVGLPQGSMLGPEFYNDYTQPMGRLIRILLLLYHLYADDAQIMKVVRHPLELQSAVSKLSHGIEKIASWMENNKLKINCDKY